MFQREIVSPISYVFVCPVAEMSGAEMTMPKRGAHNNIKKSTDTKSQEENFMLTKSVEILYFMFIHFEICLKSYPKFFSYLKISEIVLIF